MPRIGSWLLLAACSAGPPAPEAGPTVAELRAWSPNPIAVDRLQPFPDDPRARGFRSGLRAEDLHVDGPGGFPIPSAMPELWTSIPDATHDQTRGARLEERLAEFSAAQVAQNGIALLTLEELWGTEAEDYEDGLCEPLGVQWEVEEGGTAELLLWQFSAISGTPQPYEVDMTTGCQDALETSSPAEALADGSCIETEEDTFFRDGTACRTCLDAGDSWSACEDAGVCEDEGPLVFWWNGVDEQQIPVETHYGVVASCAPDWYTLFLMVAVADDDPTPPAAYDSDAWIGYCVPYWREDIDDVYFGCGGELLDGSEQHVLGEGIFTRLMGVGDPEERGAFWDRPAFAQRIFVDNGARLEHTWMGAGLGHLPAPIDQGGWGLPPLETRPGDDPDDTFARDLVSAWALKTNTRRNGVIVTYYNHNRCTEGGWRGPDARGRYLCEELDAAEEGWSEDGQTWWVDEEAGLMSTLPMMTLLTSGLPDPDVPGGVAIEIRTSPGYEALHGWSYPKTFEPDLLRYDALPGATDVSGPGGPLIGQTWRFGKDPDFDARMVMGTNTRRFHRPTGAE